ncbi:flagellar hook protein [Brevibacillus nitrificans]|uniref:Flagellar hook-associated protein 2 n=1 Tax=Brevibacillus nitrificans TaxID=651560 RepID=A0A3M8DRL8_9BACL|nr:flagellar filament capping protein FliD [Brevibacillus nitrificans]RNB90101.1 flagellar hook protein [Brevibacillus nitrificans]
MPTIRFSGMASGLDTENMVKELMKAQREPMNRIIRQKQTHEWKRDAYRDMNSMLMELRTSVDSLRFSGNFNKKKAVSENDNTVGVNIVGTPKQTTYAVKVERLAEAEMPASASLTVSSSITDTKTAIGGTSDFTLTINGEDITVSPTDTLDDVIGSIKSTTGMDASFVDGKLWIVSNSGTTLGGTNTFDISATSSDPSASGDVTPLGIKIDETKTSSAKTGQDAQVVINGITYTSKTNKVTVDGVEFTLKQAGPAINVTNQVDEDAVFSTIKSFIDKYNDVIAKINAKIAEPKYKNYNPLLDEEKEALPDSTAEKLEAMAKSGLLLRDSILKSGLDEMRVAISAPLVASGVNSAFDTLSEIGIGGPPAGKYAYQENGKLYIDEAKLKAAIRNNGADVQKLFTNFASKDSPNKYQQSGIAERLYDSLTKTINKVTKEAGSASSTSTYDDSYLGRTIRDEEDEIDRWEDRLKDMEDRYYKQFASMETMMSKAQSQSSWFAQMLGQ